MWGLLRVTLLNRERRTEAAPQRDGGCVPHWDTLSCCLPLSPARGPQAHPLLPWEVFYAEPFPSPINCREMAAQGAPGWDFSVPQLTEVVDGEVQLPDVDVDGALGNLDHLLVTCETTRER